MNREFEILEANWDSHKEKLLAVRHQVFVDEQKVPESIGVEDCDPLSIHVLAVDNNNQPIGTARLLPDRKIGRVAVLKHWRKRGVGRAIMSHLIQTARKRGDKRLSLHAQTWTTPFYQSLGFQILGEEFEEAGIPHIEMELFLD